ncbi:MAG TPA: hypothetical protein ENJ50_00630 [Planctomycetaceae bacterium]|nr:hypothetical protein [Planctomycetaceae bacterium]
MADSHKEPVDPYMAPSAYASPATGSPFAAEGDATGGLIPYKNPQALIAYYLGLFSLFPILGFFLAVPAVILGIRGLAARQRNPVIKGSVHAWIGIIMGGMFTFLWGLAIFFLVLGIVAG